jgi:hypothetical protein
VVTVLPLAAGPDWGTVPDWLAAVGTVAAFAVALGLFRKEQKARREYEEDRRREQARLISAWPEAPEVPGVKDRPRNTDVIAWMRETGTDAYVHLVMKNGSAEPVYRIFAVMVASDSSYADDPEVGAGQPGTAEARRRILPPGEEDKGIFARFLDGFETGIRPGPVSIAFTDAAGRHWKRYPDGRLVELNRPPRRPRGFEDLDLGWLRDSHGRSDPDAQGSAPGEADP